MGPSGDSFGTRLNLIMALNSQPYFGQVTIRISFQKVKIDYLFANSKRYQKWEIYKDSTKSTRSEVWASNGSNLYFPMEK
jgi:hypothetical protein